MTRKQPLPPPGAKCTCGHIFAEHIKGGEHHACQHGARPPFTNVCPCNRFKTKAK